MMTQKFEFKTKQGLMSGRNLCTIVICPYTETSEYEPSVLSNKLKTEHYCFIRMMGKASIIV